MKHFFILPFLFVMHNFVYGQTITGLVSFEDSYLPANKVSVWTDERNGTVTDSIGNYSIQVNPSTKKIYFKSSLIDYSDDALVVGIKGVKRDTVINVTLKMRVGVFDDLIVTAYVIPRQLELTSSEGDQVTIISEEKEAELLNIEKQWSAIKSNSMSFWTKVIYENINYPDIAWKNGIEGKVFAKFKIDVNGNLTDLEIIRGLHPIIDKEVLRTLNLMPSWLEYYEYYCSWVGGRNFNQLVSRRGAINYFGIFTLPIHFKIKYVKN